MKVIIQLQYSLTDSRVFHDVKNITQSSLHPTQPNTPKLKKNSDPTQPNPWMDATHDQLWVCQGCAAPAAQNFGEPTPVRYVT